MQAAFYDSIISWYQDGVEILSGNFVVNIRRSLSFVHSVVRIDWFHDESSIRISDVIPERQFLSIRSKTIVVRSLLRMWVIVRGISEAQSDHSQDRRNLVQNFCHFFVQNRIEL